MRQIILTIGVVLAIMTLLVLAFTGNQANKEELSLTSRLQSRTQVIADSLAESVEPYYTKHATTSLEQVVDRIAGTERVVGLAVFDNDGAPVVLSDGFPEEALRESLIARAMDSDEAQGEFVKSVDRTLYVFVDPIHHDERVVGALMVLQNAIYIDETIGAIWRDNLLRLVLVALLFVVAIYFLTRVVFLKPLSQLVESVQAARRGDPVPGNSTDADHFFKPISNEISKIARSLSRARSVASEEARLRLEKLDTPWTAERLKEFFKAHLKARQIFVVSNREPYVHTKRKNKITWQVPASGMVTALEPVMEACGGMWLAHGSGDADRLTVDDEDKVPVPPDEPSYILKRLWLSEEEINRYYNGFSNEALWPLCLLAHTRPIFREQDWLTYRQVNGKFAQTLLRETKAVSHPMVLIQDYHFALLPRMIKESRPDADVGLFWHIPWPNAESFSICPRRKELLWGMLGADLIGFHTQQHCNNFLDTVSKEVEAVVDFEEFSITRENHVTHVKPFPISVAFTNGRTAGPRPRSALLEKYTIETQFIGIGVDRLDYTKGILEKLKGLEFFFDAHPEYRGRFTLVQIAPPTREGVRKYREFNENVTEETERINKKFEKGGWRPILLLKEYHSHDEIYPLYRSAHLCMVTSLSDGMNLVAKEFVAARDDEAGVLILSQFAGASRDLKGALLVNPYSAEETAEAIYTALTMSASEQHRRMKRMREAVKNYNVYRWAAEFLKALSSLG